jgi:hypothetical protein
MQRHTFVLFQSSEVPPCIDVIQPAYGVLSDVVLVLDGAGRRVDRMIIADGRYSTSVKLYGGVTVRQYATHDLLPVHATFDVLRTAPRREGWSSSAYQPRFAVGKAGGMVCARFVSGVISLEEAVEKLAVATVFPLMPRFLRCVAGVPGTRLTAGSVVVGDYCCSAEPYAAYVSYFVRNRLAYLKRGRCTLVCADIAAEFPAVLRIFLRALGVGGTEFDVYKQAVMSVGDWGRMEDLRSVSKKRRIGYGTIGAPPPCISTFLGSTVGSTYPIRFQLAEIAIAAAEKAHVDPEMLLQQIHGQMASRGDSAERIGNFRACARANGSKKRDARVCVTRGKGVGLLCPYGSGSSAVGRCMSDRGVRGIAIESLTPSDVWVYGT